MKPPAKSSPDYRNIIPPEVIAAAREYLKAPRLRQTTRDRIEAAIVRAEKADAAAMHVTGRHDGNHDWLRASYAAASAAWDLLALISEK